MPEGREQTSERVKNRGISRFLHIFLYICLINRLPMTSREHIAERALQMFIARGFKSVRMDDIARQLGVSKRVLYDLFGDKEGLLHEAMVCYFEEIRRQQTAISAGAADVLEQLFIVLNDILDRSEQVGRMMNALKRSYPAVHDRLIHEGAARNREELRAMLRKGIDGGLFIDNFHIDLAISALYYSASAVTHHELIPPEGISERKAFMQIISTFFRGIATAEGLQLVDRYRLRYELSEA